MSSISTLRHKNLTDECVRLCTLITTYAQIAGGAGFSDNSKALEELVREVYSEAKGFKLTNTNAIKSNYPAIDLIDDANRVAVQVTNTASAKKVTHTINQWKDDYRLVVIGIVKGGRNQQGATVTTLAKLVAEMSAMKIGQLTKIVTILNDHIDPQTYSLKTDQACVSNLLDFLDRGAIRDLDHREGSYDKMYASCEACKVYLLSGKSDKYPVLVKPLSQYRDDIKKVLRAIEYDISSIMKICDKSRAMNGCISLQPDHTNEIDGLKSEIATNIKSLEQFI